MTPQKIQDVMTKELVTVHEDATIRDIARVMSEQNIGDVLVTDGADKLVGIVTDRDIVVRAVADGGDLDMLRYADSGPGPARPAGSGPRRGPPSGPSSSPNGWTPTGAPGTT